MAKSSITLAQGRSKATKVLDGRVSKTSTKKLGRRRIEWTPEYKKRLVRLYLFTILNYE